MPPRLRDIATYALVVVAGTVGASLASGLPFVGIPMAGMALGWLAYKRGLLASVTVTLVVSTGGALLTGGWAEVTFALPVLLAAGPGCAWALLRWPGLRTVVLLAIAMFGIGVLYRTLLANQEGMSFLALQRLEASQAASALGALMRATGSTDAKAIKEATADSARTSFLLWPTSLAYMYLLAAALVVPLVTRMGRTVGRAVNGLPKLADLDLPIHVVWPAIAGLALLAASTYLGQTQTLLWAVGLNLLMLARAPLFVQGLGDFAAWYAKLGVPKAMRIFGFTLITVSEFGIPVVSVIGLLDLFANLRRLPRAGSTPHPGLEGPRGRD